MDQAVAARYGLSLAEMLALDHLESAGELTPGQLGPRLQLTSGAVTALIDRLERRGLAERAPNPTDRRSTVVRLTERTQRFAREAYEPFVRDVDRAARRLSATESDAVTRFMDDLAEIAADHAALQGGEARGDKPASA